MGVLKLEVGCPAAGGGGSCSWRRGVLKLDVGDLKLEVGGPAAGGGGSCSWMWGT